ncbi:hypothetical protein LINPERPRIM_LOCUS95 [Linum perenne]
MISANDKRGGAEFSYNQNKPFLDCCNLCNLSITRFFRPRFTWYRGLIAERLDRVVINEHCQVNFPFTTVHHLRRLYSDHHCILVHYDDINCTRLNSPFLLLAPWLGHHSFKNCLQNAWKERFGLSAKLFSPLHNIEEVEKPLLGMCSKGSRISPGD